MDTNIDLSSAGQRPIVAARVDDAAQRLLCLPAVAGGRSVVLESSIYDFMETLCPQYDGGYWVFYRMSNGGFYMALDSAQSFELSSPNGYVERVSADTAGIIACAFAYSHLSFSQDGERFARAYQRLVQYIWQHPEVQIIQAALD